MGRPKLVSLLRGLLVAGAAGLWFVAGGSSVLFGQLTSAEQAPTAPGAVVSGAFVPRIYKDASGEHKYQIFVPRDYSADKKWPVILYLHGAGERGTDGVLQTTVGLGPYVKQRAATFPFFVVFPQCEDTQGRILTAWSASSPDGQRALAILEAVQNEFAIDRTRCVLTGWSMGGYGTWSLGAADPKRWSALVPVAGGGETAWAPQLKDIPIWAFAGANDQVVPARATRQMVDAIRAAGAHPLYSEVPDVGHDIWKVAYNDNRLFEWMLAPSATIPSATIPAGTRSAGSRAGGPAAVGSTLPAPQGRRALEPAEEGPFIPAVTIPHAIYVRLGNAAIKALANSAPRLIPPSALNGRVNDISSSTQASGYTFSVQFAGITYSAQLERVWAKAYANDRLNIQLGLRNINMMIGSTYVQGAGRSAVAGPISVVIGNRYPIWLSFDVAPYVSEGKLRLQLVGTRFEIPSDDWYVSPPYGVRTRGLGMTEDRVSSALVEGIYGQKSRIEQEAASIVPSLLPLLEDRLAFEQVTQAAAGFWPLPVYRPRLRVFPESVAVDENGISLLMSVTAAAPDPRKAPATPTVAQTAPLSIDAIPHDTELRVGINPNILAPLTKLLVDENVARVNVLDIPDSTFAAIADRKVLTEVVPETASLPPDTQISAEIVLKGSIRVRDAGPASPGNSPNQMPPSQMAQKADRPLRVTALKVNSADPTRNPAPKSAPRPAAAAPRTFEFDAPKLVLEISVKEPHSTASWKPFVAFDMDLIQGVEATLLQRGFSERALRIGWTGKPTVKVSGHFAPGYTPKNPEINNDTLRDLFTVAWIAWMQTSSTSQVPVPDVDFGYAKLRLDGVQWLPPVLSILFDEPVLKITNSSKVDLVYEAKEIDSEWGGPYTLKPGQSHAYKVAAPLYFRRLEGGQFVQSYTLAVGSQFDFHVPPGKVTPDLYEAPPAR